MKAALNQSIEDNNENKCCWRGCQEEGNHPAPKSPTSLKDRYHFCLNHIRQYNKSWDFFKNMTQTEVESFQISSLTGHRPTSKIGYDKRYYNTDELKEQIFREFNLNGETKKPRQQAPQNEKDALEVLGLKYPVSLKEIKRKYKELVKLYHPDAHNQKDEEKLKIINQAYNHLKNCGHF